MRAWLVATAFLAGAALMCLELVGSRLLAPSFGGSIEVWGSLIGVVLAALAVGHQVGGRLVDRWPSLRLLGVLLAVSAVAVWLPLLAREAVLRAAGQVAAQPRWGALLVTAALLGPGGLALGTVTPAAVRLRAAGLEGVGLAAGAITSASSLGGILGALGAAFFLVPRFSTTGILLGLGLGLALLALATLAVTGSRLVAGMGGVLVLIGASLLALSGYAGGSASGQPGADGPDASAFPGAPVATARSAYHDLAVWDLPSPDPGVEIQRWLLMDGVPQGVVSVVEGEVDLARTPEQTRVIRGLDLLFAGRPGIEGVLFVGLGAGAGPGRVAALHPQTRVDVVEIDPVVIDLARAWFALDEARVAVHHGDGRAWLAARSERWDAIVLDAYDGDLVPFHLATAEYLRVVRQRLVPGGVGVANVVGAMSGEGSGLVRATVRTWQEVFAHVVVHPISSVNLDRTVTPWHASAEERQAVRHVLVFGSDAPFPDLPALVAATEALAREGLADEGSVEVARTRREGPLDLAGVAPLTDDRAPVHALGEGRSRSRWMSAPR